MLNSTTSNLNMDGGGRKKKDKNSNLKRAMNPGFEAFQKLKNYIATKLEFKNPIKAAKIASAVKKECNEHHPNLDSVKLAEKSMEYFDKNIKKFKEMI
jgi:hypothetical protein